MPVLKTFKNGKWEPLGGSGGSSIDVTAAVGQTIIVEEVDANDKPIKWKAVDCQPRTHWEEELEILPNTTVENAGNGEFLVSKSVIPVVVDEEYAINFNGTEYILKCVDITDLASGAPGKVLLLGSIEFPPAEGEPPFGIMVMENVPDMANMTLVMTGSEYEGTSITIGIKQMVAQQIPNKFIPSLEKMRTSYATILPKTFIYFDENGEIEIPADSAPFKVNKGESYKIIWNETEYICTATEMLADDGERVIVIGNISLATGTGDTGEPFFSMITENGYTFIVALDGSTSAYISIENATYKKIPTKFIPSLEDMRMNVGAIILPESTTSDDVSGNDIGEFIFDKINIIEGKHYLVTFNGVEYTCVCKLFANQEEEFFYLGNQGLINTELENTREPFILEVGPNADYTAVFTKNDNTRITISVKELEIQKIPNKFIPSLEEMRSKYNVLFEGSIEPDENSELIFSVATDFIFGNTYKIGWNGSKYLCEAMDGTSFIPTGFETIVLGNIEAAMGSGDTGEPFVIIYIPAEGLGMAVPLTEDFTTPLELYIAELAYESIPAKLIPPIEELLLDTFELLPPTELTGASSNSQYVLDTVVPLTSGQTYIVNWNDTDYTRVAFEVSDIVCLGNKKVSTNVDTGEPFLFGNVVFGDNIKTICMITDETTSPTVSISKVQRIAKIPKACLPEMPVTSVNGQTGDVTIDIPKVPAVTEADNGAFLRVVNGVWTAIKLPNVEDGEF